MHPRKPLREGTTVRCVMDGPRSRYSTGRTTKGLVLTPRTPGVIPVDVSSTL